MSTKVKRKYDYKDVIIHEQNQKLDKNIIEIRELNKTIQDLNNKLEVNKVQFDVLRKYIVDKNTCISDRDNIIDKLTEELESLRQYKIDMNDKIKILLQEIINCNKDIAESRYTIDLLKIKIEVLEELSK